MVQGTVTTWSHQGQVVQVVVHGIAIYVMYVKILGQSGKPKSLGHY